MAVWVVELRVDCGWGGTGGHGDNIGNVHDVVVGDDVALVWDGESAGGEGRNGDGGAHFEGFLVVGCGCVDIVVAGITDPIDWLLLEGLTGGLAHVLPADCDVR